jgi:hypothetical protein
MDSCLYEGTLRHRRFTPAAHGYTYGLFMMYLDLDELPELFRDRWLWSCDRPALARFWRRDHLGDPTRPLSEAVRDLVERTTGVRPTGPIRLLTHLRYFGYGFNPVSFYYCFDRDGQQVETIVAEVNNTPWGEQHPYVLGASLNEAGPGRKRYRFNKAFHVSPFMDMDVQYDWRFTDPGRHLTIHMDNWQRDSRFFDATMTMARTEITGGSLARVLAQYPMMTAKVIGAIYWNALRLWLKRVPVHAHPGTGPIGRSTRPSSKAAASEGARRTFAVR